MWLPPVLYAAVIIYSIICIPHFFRKFPCDKMFKVFLFSVFFVGTRAGLSGGLKSGDWNMVFRATSGNGHNTHKAWMFGNGTSAIKPNDMERSCGPHYRSPLIKIWDFLDIRKVKLAFFEHAKEVAYVIFDGRNSDKMNWFSKDRILFSSWCDLHPDLDYNYFSIPGDQYHGRTFFINFDYNGCDNDRGHVVTTETISRKGCPWDKQPVYPQFLYSKINHADHWNMNRFGRADYMAVYIETNFA